MDKPEYFITQSLLSSWLYLDKAGEHFDEAYRDFLCALERKPAPVTPKMQRGIEYEAEVLECSRDYDEGFPADVRAIARIVRGGIYQATATRRVEAAGVTFVIYAKCDWLKAGDIYDVKRSDSYEVGKYRDSPQHSMYLAAIPEARRFVYLISDGKDVYHEIYTREDTPPIEDALRAFTQYLLDTGLWETYAAHWRN